MTDLIDQVCEELHIDRDIRAKHEITLDEALVILKRLSGDIQTGQRAIGFLLWHLDPTPAELAKIAEQVQLSPEALRSWMNTYSRLSDSHARLKFSMQQQLARIVNPDEREALFASRPEDEWTLPLLKEAVEAHLYRNHDILPKQKRAGCSATYGGRKMRTRVTMTERAVTLDLALSDGELDDGIIEKVDDGLYRIKFRVYPKA